MQELVGNGPPVGSVPTGRATGGSLNLRAPRYSSCARGWPQYVVADLGMLRGRSKLHTGAPTTRADDPRRSSSRTRNAAVTLQVEVGGMTCKWMAAVAGVAREGVLEAPAGGAGEWAVTWGAGHTQEMPPRRPPRHKQRRMQSDRGKAGGGPYWSGAALDPCEWPPRLGGRRKKLLAVCCAAESRRRVDGGQKTATSLGAADRQGPLGWRDCGCAAHAQPTAPQPALPTTPTRWWCPHSRESWRPILRHSLSSDLKVSGRQIGTKRGRRVNVGSHSRAVSWALSRTACRKREGVGQVTNSGSKIR